MLLSSTKMIESTLSYVALHVFALGWPDRVAVEPTTGAGADNQDAAAASGGGSSGGDGGSGSIVSTDSTPTVNPRKSRKRCRSLESAGKTRSFNSSVGLNWTGSDSDSSTDSEESEGEHGGRAAEDAWDSKIAGVRGKEVSDQLFWGLILPCPVRRLLALCCARKLALSESRKGLGSQYSMT